MKWQAVKTVLWSAVGGALVWWIVLGAGLGWRSAGSAEEQAAKRANTAVLDVLTPICVERFNQDAESVTKLKALQESSTWNRAGYVVEQGWATTPGKDIPENQIAKACASQILTANRS